MTTLLQSLRRKQNEYIAKLRAQGVEILSYTVPCCGRTEETRVGPLRGQWDTLATCSHCGATYMKITRYRTVLALKAAE